MNNLFSALPILFFCTSGFASNENSRSNSLQEKHLALQNESVATQKELTEIVNQISNAQLKIEETSGFVEDRRKKFAYRISALNSLANQKWGIVFYNKDEISLRKSLGLLQLTSQKDLEQLASYKVGRKNLTTQVEKLNQSKMSLQTRLKDLAHAQKKISLLEKNLIAGFAKNGFRSLLSKKGSLTVPIKRPIKSQYGSIRDDIGDFTFFQSGLYFFTEPQEQVASIGDGKVVFADHVFNRGDTVIVEHDGGYFSVYSRLGKTHVRLDQEVHIGQQIGTTSDSDFYFELRQHSIPIDPKPWLKLDTKGQL